MISLAQARSSGRLRVVGAIAWMRWRVSLNGIRGIRQGDGGDRLARAAEIGSWIILAGILAPVTIGVAVAAFWGGRLLADGPHGGALLFVRVVLLAELGLLALTPFLRSPGSFGSAARLRLLPVPGAMLHGAALLSTLGDPWIAALAPGLLALPAGLLPAGFVAAAIALLACMLMLAVMLSLASAAELSVQLLVRDRRRGESVLLIVMLSLTLAGFLPLLLADRIQGTRAAESEEATEAPRGMPAWIDALPPGQLARALEAVASRRPAQALPHCAVLAITALALGAASFALHARVLEEPERMSPGRRGKLPRVHARGPASPVACLATLHVRGVTRTVWGRLAVFSPPIVVGLLALVQRELAELGAAVAIFPGRASHLFFAGASLSLLNLQASLANQFAVDRAGLTLQFLVPVTDRQIVAAKAMAGGLLLGFSAAASALVALLLGEPGDVAEWLGAVLAVASAYALVAPLSAVLSATFPRAVDAARIVASSGPHVAASTIGTVAILAALAAPALLFAGGRLVSGPALGLGLVAAWAAAAGLACRATLPMAADVLTSRRERLVMIAKGG